MNLTKAKREYIRLKPLNKRKFSPTDCIPLINSAWERSFAKVEYAKKAILQRGWNPLNYVLLDHPKLIPLPPDKQQPLPDEIGNQNVDVDVNNTTTISTTDAPTAVNTDNTNNSNNLLDNIYINGPVSNSYMDELLEKQALREGQKRKIEEKKQAQQTHQDLLDRLAGLGRITSGKLADTNHYHLCHNLYDEMGRRIGNEKEKQQECQQKRLKVQAKQTDNFRKSYQKFISNQPLAVADMRNLINRVKLRDDSPVKTRSADLKQQWEKRKHRYDDFLPTPRSIGETGLIPVQLPLCRIRY
jgi:hypothetical protein